MKLLSIFEDQIGLLVYPIQPSSGGSEKKLIAPIAAVELGGGIRVNMNSAISARWPQRYRWVWPWCIVLFTVIAGDTPSSAGGGCICQGWLASSGGKKTFPPVST